MKMILILSVAVGILFSTNAMAIHTCGQPIGSCLVHIDPIVFPDPPRPPEPAPARRVLPQSLSTPITEPAKCYKQIPGQVLVEIVCPR